ncbi:hypothetical protein [Dolosigranulum pigrum]|uniref:hypothetical protein n=1 Tax=Dolosigranulum pigrum TaxID=29394 RepID=UPI001AD87259|nr:hypothetical protein [Dolosigranulum pigrum]
MSLLFLAVFLILGVYWLTQRWVYDVDVRGLRKWILTSFVLYAITYGISLYLIN